MATIDELLLGSEQGNEGRYMKSLFRSLVQGTKASNAIPSGEDYACASLPGPARAAASDYAYHVTAFPAFSHHADRASASIAELMDNILKHLDRDSDGVGGLEEAADLSTFELLAEMMEDLLEDVELHIRNEQSSQQPGALPAPAVDTIRTITYATKSKANAYRSLMSQLQDIPKPQLAFATDIDNRRESSFIPRPHGKPEFRPPHGARDCPHPYAAEISGLSYQPWQLKVPSQADLATTRPHPLDQSSPLIFIDTPEAVAQMVCQIREELDQEAEKLLAIDLEAHSLRTFQGLVCLMQISTREQDWIVDTLMVRRSMYLLSDLFSDPTVCKVLHGASSDIQWLQRDFSLYIVNLFDTYLAAKHLHLPQASLARLLEKYCHLHVDKTYQLADWRMRPLPQSMINYAREDTHYLLYIYDCLRRDLVAREGRQGLVAVLDASREVSLLRYTKEVFDPNGYLKLLLGPKGGRNKFGQQFGSMEEVVLKALWDWRDRCARENDESISYICSQKMLIRLAAAAPRTFEGLRACANPLPHFLLQDADEVLEAINIAIQKANHGPPIPQTAIRYARPPPGRPNGPAAHFSPPHASADLTSPSPPLYPPSQLEYTGSSASTQPHSLASGQRQPGSTPSSHNGDMRGDAGWTAPLPPPRQNWADALIEDTLQGVPPSAALNTSYNILPASRNHGLETDRRLDHSLDLRGRVDGFEGGASGHLMASLKARRETREEGKVMPTVEWSDEEHEEGGEDDEEIDMPRTMAEIYRISNRNRQKNKEKKRGQQNNMDREKEGGGEGETVEEDSMQQTGERGGKDASLEDTMRFMASIGWIPGPGDAPVAPYTAPGAGTAALAAGRQAGVMRGQVGGYTNPPDMLMGAGEGSRGRQTGLGFGPIYTGNSPGRLPPRRHPRPRGYAGRLPARHPRSASHNPYLIPGPRGVGPMGVDGSDPTHQPPDPTYSAYSHQLSYEQPPAPPYRQNLDHAGADLVDYTSLPPSVVQAMAGRGDYDPGRQPGYSERPRGGRRDY